MKTIILLLSFSLFTICAFAQVKEQTEISFGEKAKKSKFANLVIKTDAINYIAGRQEITLEKYISNGFSIWGSGGVTFGALFNDRLSVLDYPYENDELKYKTSNRFSAGFRYYTTSQKKKYKMQGLYIGTKWTSANYICSIKDPGFNPNNVQFTNKLTSIGLEVGLQGFFASDFVIDVAAGPSYLMAKLQRFNDIYYSANNYTVIHEDKNALYFNFRLQVGYRF